MSALTAIRARWVLAYQDGGHRLLDNGVVHVRGEHIVDVGTAVAEGADVIDLGDAVVLPGLIDLDALTDIDHAILDSWHPGERAAKLRWSETYATGADRTDTLTLDERATMRRFAIAELLLHGVTTAMPIASEVHSEWAETFDDAVVLATEAEALGIRMFVGPSFRSGVPMQTADGLRIHWDPPRGREGLADAVRFVEWVRENASARIEGVLLPCRIETLDPMLLPDIAAAAEQLDTLVRLHCLQGMDELRLLGAHGTTPIQMLDEAGLLTPRLLIPHAIYTDGNSRVGAHGGGPLEALAHAGVSIVHCPLTSAHYGAALESFDSYKAAGVNIALGTDSYPPDMLRGMDLGSSIAKILEGRLDAGRHQDYLDAATLGGAAALRRDDLGRLSVGAAADIIAIRLDDVRDGVVDDPIRTMIAHTTARAVDFSMVAGTVRVSGGDLIGVDMPALRAQAQGLFAKLKRGYVERLGEPISASELFPPSYPQWQSGQDDQV